MATNGFQSALYGLVAALLQLGLMLFSPHKQQAYVKSVLVASFTFFAHLLTQEMNTQYSQPPSSCLHGATASALSMA